MILSANSVYYLVEIISRTKTDLQINRDVVKATSTKGSDQI